MRSRVPLVAGNWKMNTTVPEGVALAQRVSEIALVEGVEVVVLPPFTHLWPVAEVLRGSHVAIGAQNVYWQASGAYTGEISATMLSGWCDFVLVGHSERRHIMGETDEEIRRKLEAARAAELSVILAVGETDAERDAGRTEGVVSSQLDAGLAGLNSEQLARCVVAYEPVWAIGTGRTATPEQAQDVCRLIRERAASLHGEEAAAELRVLYGGSVTGANAATLFAAPDIDGGLIGGASLKPDDFAEIVMAAPSASGRTR